MYVAHKHIIMQASHIFWFLLFGLFIPWYLYASNPVLLWLSASILIVSWIKFLYSFVLYFFDCWVITNRGVIDVVWTSLFNRKSVRYTFDNFEGITTEINGFWNTVLRKGDVLLIRNVQDSNQVKLTNAAFPGTIEGKVLKAKQEYIKSHQQKQSNQHTVLTEIIAGLVTEYADKNGIKLD